MVLGRSGPSTFLTAGRKWATMDEILAQPPPLRASYPHPPKISAPITQVGTEHHRETWASPSTGQFIITTCDAPLGRPALDLYVSNRLRKRLSVRSRRGLLHALTRSRPPPGSRADITLGTHDSHRGTSQAARTRARPPDDQPGPILRPPAFPEAYPATTTAEVADHALLGLRSPPLGRHAAPEGGGDGAQGLVLSPADAEADARAVSLQDQGGGGGDFATHGLVHAPNTGQTTHTRSAPP